MRYKISAELADVLGIPRTKVAAGLRADMLGSLRNWMAKNRATVAALPKTPSGGVDWKAVNAMHRRDAANAATSELLPHLATVGGLGLLATGAAAVLSPKKEDPRKAATGALGSRLL